MAPSAILFDLDGTLLDSERESAEAAARALSRGLGIFIDQDDRDFMIGRSWVDIYDHLRARYADLTWSRAELANAAAEIRGEVFREMGARILPGAVPAVRRFSKVPLALVTGSSRREATEALELLGLADAFSLVVASEDVPRSKPDPEGYLRASARLGVSPARALAVEDSRAGIAAARSAGAKVVAVRAGNFAGQDQSEADWVVDSLDALTWEAAGSLFAALA